jgi:hypothetical protein
VYVISNFNNNGDLDSKGSTQTFGRQLFSKNGTKIKLMRAFSISFVVTFFCLHCSLLLQWLFYTIFYIYYILHHFLGVIAIKAMMIPEGQRTFNF